ncbi:ion transporter [Hyphococcus sp. DH-69]|uniref:ion transporter n=1 Tax=Hyphococcus formosus TaxID=3143534 RepID=UPI00398A798A
MEVASSSTDNPKLGPAGKPLPQTPLQRFVENQVFQTTVLVLIVINAIILGAETLSGLDDVALGILRTLDHIIIYAFVIEIGIRIIAYRSTYFRNGWNLFDFLIVVISIGAATSGLAALRAFRVLRVLRVITVIPRMRVVVSALLDSIPGIASVGVVILLIVYVFAVIAANLYGGDHPELFGNVFSAMYTLFQVMTLEGWPDIASEVSKTHSRSWIFFLTFVLIATFTMLNLFVAIVVRVVEEDSEEDAQTVIDGQSAIRKEISALRVEIEALSKRLPPAS